MVEALATAIGKIVIREFGAPWVKVSVAKPGAIPRGARGRHRHRAHRGRLCLRSSSGPAATPTRTRALRRAAAELERPFGAMRCSSVYRSAAVGGPGGRLPRTSSSCSDDGARRRFACATRCARSRRSRAAVAPIRAVVRARSGLAAVWRARRRAAGGCRDPDLFTVPFVLGPLAELAPDLAHPVTGRTLRARVAAARAATSSATSGALRSLGVSGCATSRRCGRRRRR